jgi:hypothetical protein
MFMTLIGGATLQDGILCGGGRGWIGKGMSFNNDYLIKLGPVFKMALL